MSNNIILASKSKVRKEILDKHHILCEVKPSNVDEDAVKESLISELEQVILQIRKKKIDGVNVTVPFKKAVIPFLDELTFEAKNTQSVNTIYLKNNKLIGHNTDIIGFETSIEMSEYNILNKEVLILGAGGVVPSIIFALKKMKVSKIKISNRTIGKAENLKKLLGNISGHQLTLQEKQLKKQRHQ